MLLAAAPLAGTEEWAALMRNTSVEGYETEIARTAAANVSHAELEDLYHRFPRVFNLATLTCHNYVAFRKWHPLAHPNMLARFAITSPLTPPPHFAFCASG